MCDVKSCSATPVGSPVWPFTKKQQFYYDLSCIISSSMSILVFACARLLLYPGLAIVVQPFPISRSSYIGCPVYEKLKCHAHMYGIAIAFILPCFSLWLMSPESFEKKRKHIISCYTFCGY